jgi:DNA-binding response OmpR family regulator
VSREALKRAAFVNGGDDRMLNLYIHYLREKLEQDGIRRIFASRGKGYYLQC